MTLSTVRLKIFLALIIVVAAISANNLSIETIGGRPKFILELSLLLVGALSLFLIIQNREVPKIPIYIIILLTISTFSSAYNSIMIDDIRPFRVFLVTNFSIVSIYLFFSDVKIKTYIDTLTKVLVILSLIIIITSLIFEPITLYRYKGIFDHSNSMGRVSGYLFLIIFSYTLFFKKSLRVNILMMLFLLITFYILLATNSRTPLFTAMFFIFLAIFIFNSRGLINIFRYTRFKIHYYFLIILLLICSLFLVNRYIDSGSDIHLSLYENFQYQFVRYPGSYGTSDRIIRWSNAIDNYYSFFGSREYAEKSFSKIEVHNNYISQTLKYGLIPSICFHLLPLIIFFKSFFQIVKTNSRSSIIPLCLSFFLLLYYIFETGAALAPFWIMIIYDAILSSRKKIK